MLPSTLSSAYPTNGHGSYSAPPLRLCFIRPQARPNQDGRAELHRAINLKRWEADPEAAREQRARCYKWGVNNGQTKNPSMAKLAEYGLVISPNSRKCRKLTPEERRSALT